MVLPAGKPVTSAGKFMGWNTVFGVEGDHATPYMTRMWFWRLRLHIFHRGDADPDCHDHPWGFWTFPLTSYVEETVVLTGCACCGNFDEYEVSRDIVRRFRLHYRPAEHTHRVLGRYSGSHPVLDPDLYAEGRRMCPDNLYDNGKIVTLVWRTEPQRKWGFLKNRDGRWCWVPWKEYVFNGGKDAPCQ